MRPYLLASLEERENQIILRRNVLIQSHFRHAGTLDDRVHANSPHSMPAEEIVGCRYQPLASVARFPSLLMTDPAE